MVVRYLITPKDGRIGKARLIKPFEMQADGRPHNLDRIQSMVMTSVKRYVKDRTAFGVIDIDREHNGPHLRFLLEVFCDRSVKPIATIKIEEIEA